VVEALESALYQLCLNRQMIKITLANDTGYPEPYSIKIDLPLLKKPT